jgi:hypothetical protein
LANSAALHERAAALAGGRRRTSEVLGDVTRYQPVFDGRVKGGADNQVHLVDGLGR